MRKLHLFIAILFMAGFAYAQDEVICHTSSTDKFALFASNKDFNKNHSKPRAYVHQSQEGGKMITIKTPDGKDANAFLITAKKPTDNWILVFQEWWGLNDNVKRQSEQLYKDVGDVNILALDMYDGKIATDAETAGHYMQEFKQERGDNIVKGALQYVGAKARIGTVGWCFGGGQSLLASLAAGKQAIATVMYYGMPVDDVSKLKTLNAPVLAIFGSKDKWINPEVAKKFEDNMKAAGKELVVKMYDADHAFANPSNAIGTYDEADAKDADKETVKFFKEKMKDNKGQAKKSAKAKKK
jgi:carboxymethylenebutenolidase